MEAVELKLESTAPAELGVHFDTVKEKIPGWLYKAPAEIRLLFREHLLALETSRQEVRRIMAQFQSIDGFCLPRLTQALEQQIDGDLNIQQGRFVRTNVTYLSSIFEDRIYTSSHAQTLLEAALQNFEVGEAESDALNGRAIVQFPDRKAALAPQAFARLCRTLDLGALYQAHIDSVFNPSSQLPGNTPSVKARFADHDKQALRVSADIAYMKGDIALTTYDVLMDLARGVSGLRLGGELLHCSRMRMFDIELSGWVVIGAKLSQDSPGPCIAYIPGGPPQSIEALQQFYASRT